MSRHVITSITTRHIRLAVILVIMFISIFKPAYIYIYIHIQIYIHTYTLESFPFPLVYISNCIFEFWAVIFQNNDNLFGILIQVSQYIIPLSNFRKILPSALWKEPINPNPICIFISLNYFLLKIINKQRNKT